MTIARLTDDELVRLFAQTRQPAYFDQLYRRHYGSVLRTCRSYATNSAEAYDLAQDAFVRAWHGIQQVTQHGSFQAWLQTVARNHCIDHLRRRKSRNLIFCDTDHYANLTVFDPADDEDAQANQARLGVVFQLLSENDQRLFTGHYLDKVSLRELAHQHQISEGAVKMRLLRARTRLRAAF